MLSISRGGHTVYGVCRLWLADGNFFYGGSPFRVSMTGCIVFLAGIDAQCEPCEADGCNDYAGVGGEAEREEGELCVQDAQCADGGNGLFEQDTVECCKADDGCPVGYA